MPNLEFNNFYDLLRLTILLFSPAFLGNMFPVIFLKIPIINRGFKYPLDFGKSLGGKRIFGNNKTIGGFLLAIIGGALAGVMLYLIGFLSSLNFAIFYGSWIGMWAILGDVIKSFFKRRFGIESGKSWPFFDQVDFIIGAWIGSIFISGFSKAFSFNGTWQFFVMAILITLPLHLLTNLLAYKLKMKDVWW